jgi:hypothetical protein
MRSTRGWVAAAGLVLATSSAACELVATFGDSKLRQPDAGAGGSTATSSGSGGMTCTPASTMACYSGPTATEGVGLCVRGTLTCKPDGSGYGACEGEVTPVAETCASTADENCDKYDCVQWAELFGNLQGSQAQGVAVDAMGNSYVVGYFSGLLQLPEQVLTAVGDSDAFVLKLDPGGKPIWGRSFGAPGASIGALAVAVDASGAVAFGGAATAPISFDTKSTGPGIYVTKLDADGNVLWAEGLTTSYKNPSYDEIYSVAMTSKGDVVVGGHFTSDIDFGDGVVLGSPAPIKFSYGFVAKLRGSDGSGKQSDGGWGKPLCSGASGCTVSKVAVVGMDDVLVAGSFDSHMTFAPTVSLQAKGTLDIFLAKLTTAGGPVWTQQIGGSGVLVTFRTMVASADGGATVVGDFSGTVQLTLTVDATSGSDSDIIVRYGADKAYLWNQPVKHGFITSGAADVAGNVFLAGQFTGSLDLGAESGPLVSNGFNNLFIAKLSNVPSLVWNKSYGDGMSLPFPTGVAVTPQGDPVVIGSMHGVVDFGTGPLTPAGAEDTFVAKFSQ